MHINIQALDYPVGTNPAAVAVVDLNKDGHLDLVTANYGANSVSVLLGNAAGTFASSPNSPYYVGVKPRYYVKNITSKS